MSKPEFVYFTRSQTDMDEGRGFMAPDMSHAFTDEQAAWDSINDLPGIFGRRPGIMSKGKIRNWQQAKLEKASFGCDHDVIRVPVTDQLLDPRMQEIYEIEEQMAELEVRLNTLRTQVDD